MPLATRAPVQTEGKVPLMQVSANMLYLIACCHADKTDK